MFNPNCERDSIGIWRSRGPNPRGLESLDFDLASVRKPFRD